MQPPQGSSPAAPLPDTQNAADGRMQQHVEWLDGPPMRAELELRAVGEDAGCAGRPRLFDGDREGRCVFGIKGPVNGCLVRGG